jgi:hypothetical protein
MQFSNIIFACTPILALLSAVMASPIDAANNVVDLGEHPLGHIRDISKTSFAPNTERRISARWTSQLSPEVIVIRSVGGVHHMAALMAIAGRLVVLLDLVTGAGLIVGISGRDVLLILVVALL